MTLLLAAVVTVMSLYAPVKVYSLIVFLWNNGTIAIKL